MELTQKALRLPGLILIGDPTFLNDGERDSRLHEQPG